MGTSVFWIFALVVISVLSTSNTTKRCSPHQCNLPQGKSGTCKYLRKCPTMLQLLLHAGSTPAVENYFKKSNCGGDVRDPKVCCTYDITIPGLQPVYGDTENKPEVVGILEHPYLPRNCGLSSYENFGGNRAFAAIDEFPWLAILEYVGPNGIKSICTGTLISPHYVLTAASCAADTTDGYKLTSVRLGEYNINSELDCAENSKGQPVCADGTVIVGIKDIIVHEGYRKERNGYRNDIALLRLSGFAEPTAFIQSICLPFSDNLPKECISSGWGLDGQHFSSGRKYRNILPLMDKAVCSREFRPSFSNVMKSHICVGREMSSNACRMDLGGPLMAFAGDEYSGGRWMLKGIFSYGSSNCGQDARERSAIYTNVIEYIPWITTHLT